MSFYNKYRPAQFSQVLGQDQVVKILKSQAMTGSYHHAYLFFGASGSGKTSTARILAMAINCLNLDGTGEPCGECHSCRAIRNHSHWDVIEVDGARFRGIDDIKELTFRAYLAPFNSNKKIYIIDEVHALTNDAFNCLLRLIEEPPPHLVVILCTTEFARIPETVSSRCQLFPFTKLTADDITRKLEFIARSEGITPDPRHIQFIVESSGGNMRSAENILEQVCQAKGG
jgi:DNA polymerase-3 subunit gamma/tau